MNLDKRLLRQLRSARVQLGLAVGLGFLSGILLVLQAYGLSQVVSRVFLDGHNLHDVRALLVALGIVAVLRAATLWGGEVAAQHVAGHIKANLRERLCLHLIALGPAYTREERSGELTTTANDGIEALDAYFSQYIPQLALAALIPLTVLVVIFPLDWLSGVVLLLTAPMIPIFMVLIGHLANTQSRQQWTQLSRMSAHFLDVLQGLTTLKLFGRSREQIQTIAHISARFRDSTMSVLRIAFLSALALEMLATISTAVVAVEIGLRLLYARIPFDEAFFVLILAPEYYLPLRMLGTRFHAGVAGLTAAQRIFEVLETPVELTAPVMVRDVESTLSSDLQPLPDPIFPIIFETVQYAYADGTRPALHDVSFTIQPGQKVALVGPSGSGKSTVAQLCLRFIEPAAGRITVAGYDLHTMAATSWREQIAWVPQFPYLFAANVADNICLARPDATRDDVIRAVQQAHADTFIRALPEGYATPIGERGERLSGGQAQRIALARAFLKDAPFLILDEATSNLDPETEQLLQGAIRTLEQGRTVLVIAHRLSTVMDADQIIVLEEGRVVEHGNHAELITQRKVYHRLINAHSER